MAAISSDILASYAADAAREVEGVLGLAEHALHRHKGVRVLGDDGGFSLELHLVIVWGASIPAVGAAVQKRVVEYLRHMADLEPDRVDVVVDEIGPR
jgi:uncharacterized alkaline shock family protein YloU